MSVIAVDFGGDERRGLTATCRRDGSEHTVARLEIQPVGPIAVHTQRLLDAYRRWSMAR